MPLYQVQDNDGVSLSLAAEDEEELSKWMQALCLAAVGHTVDLVSIRKYFYIQNLGLSPDYGATFKIRKKSNFDRNQLKVSKQHKYMYMYQKM